MPLGYNGLRQNVFDKGVMMGVYYLHKMEDLVKIDGAQESI